MTPSASPSGSSDPPRAIHVAAGNLFGGIERMLLSIAGAPASRGRHDVAVSADGRLARELRARDAGVHVVGPARFSRPDTIWRARRALDRVLASSGAGALIAHAPWSYALAAPVARRSRTPILLWVHDAPQAAHFLERRVTARPPAALICNSSYTAGLAAAWLPQVPRTVIHPPVEPHEAVSAGDRHAIRRGLGADERTTVILLAARLEAWKGHQVLIEAASRLRGPVAIWIAGGPQRSHESEYLASLADLAERLLPGSIRFLGERADVPKLMAAADVYCQPNTAAEPFGVVFAEALSAGTPVVTTAMGGAVEIVDDRCGILLSDPSSAAVAAALQRLADDPALRASLGAHGPARAAHVTDPAARLREIDDVVAAHLMRSSAA
jgi:glycosyltransferase involved in cell wall biosynthesis